MTGALVISLDFELLWGVRDHADRQSYGRNVLGARQAVPRLLDLFAANGIRATWATVGFLFCETKDELLASLPELRPTYADSRLSNYTYLDEVGADEKADPYYFAPSLIEAIRQTPGQEIGTHTMSHCYCLEPGMTVAAFEADLAAARRLAEAHSIEIKSIVFPRNQFAPEYLQACSRQGITHFRGNPPGWAYQATDGAGQTPLRRALRLVDAHTGLLGGLDFGNTASGSDPASLRDVPASRFLRPRAGRLGPLHPMHLAVIERGMTAAARAGRGYHLWWHPHNFGVNLDANMAGIARILAHFATLADRFGMRSAAMEDFV